MADNHLAGTTVIIPGASRAIGRAIAHKFGRAGASLVLPWFDWPESVREMQEELAAAGYPYLDVPCDLRDRDQVQSLVEEASVRFQRIDMLINNIERGGMPVVTGGYELDHNRDQWNLELDTTLKAKWNLYQCCRPFLKKSGSGAVVNISSIAAHIGRSGPAACFFNDAFSAANRAVGLFTENWAREMAPEVRVNEIMLGLIRTRHGEETRGWSALSAEERRALQEHTLLSRQGHPDEVAELVFFLAVRATYLTGSIIRMDGGYLLGGSSVSKMPPGIL